MNKSDKTKCCPHWESYFCVQYCTANNVSHKQAHNVYHCLRSETLLWTSPSWKSLSIELTKGKCVTLHFSSPKTNRYCCWFTPPPRPVWHQRKGTRLSHHTHTLKSISLFICFLHSTQSPLCLSVTALFRLRHMPVKLTQHGIRMKTR